MRASLNDLPAVVAVARRGSFRAAAIDLGMSTTALSQAVAKLEAGLGVCLFNRTTRSVALSQAGRGFVAAVAPALGDIDAAIAAARSQRETPAGTLRINAAPTADARDHAAGAGVRAPFSADDGRPRRRGVPHRHLADGFDLGVRVKSLVPADMIAVPLGAPQRFAAVGSPAYFERHPVPVVPADLIAQECLKVRLPNGALWRWHSSRDGETIDVDVDGPLTLDEASLARMAVLSGIALGSFMEADVRADIAAGRLVRVLSDWTPPSAPLCLYYPGRRHAAAGLRAFLALAREMAPDAPAPVER